jgi:hypothetical protein
VTYLEYIPRTFLPGPDDATWTPLPFSYARAGIAQKRSMKIRVLRQCGRRLVEKSDLELWVYRSHVRDDRYSTKACRWGNNAWSPDLRWEGDSQ